MVKMMKRSSEFENRGKLYVISSPIGNLKDITLRALETLKEVEYLFSEDTRVTKKLLSSYSISRSLNSFHDYSDDKKEDYIMSLLLSGHDCGIISDCGTPLISDPGFELVKRCTEEGIKIVPVPGASASVAALTMSGLNVKPYMFYGFLDHKESKKIKELEKLKDYDFTIIFYESPLRVNETIKDIFEVFGDRKCALLREITKMYEEAIYFNLSEYKDIPIDLKGEMVIVVSKKEDDDKEETIIDTNEEMNKLIKDGFSVKEASKNLGLRLNKKSSDIYNEYIRNRK